MRGLLIIFIFSGLLTAGTSLMCETCQSIGDSCTGNKETCGADKDTCATVTAESITGGNSTKNVSIVKSCYEKSRCNSGGNSLVNGVNTTVTIQCSKAPLSTASFLLALSGFLIMQILLK